MTRAFIGLGSNLEDPVRQVCSAAEELGSLPHTRLRARSSLYRSAPMGPAGQPDYINAVAELDTGLDAEPLLDALHAIEDRHGRRRGEHWGARTLDLDILLYGSQVIDSDRLRVPHPGIGQRSFVLVPLAELAPALTVPGLGEVSCLLGQCAMDAPERLEQACHG